MCVYVFCLLFGELTDLDAGLPECVLFGSNIFSVSCVKDSVKSTHFYVFIFVFLIRSRVLFCLCANCGNHLIGFSVPVFRDLDMHACICYHSVIVSIERTYAVMC